MEYVGQCRVDERVELSVDFKDKVALDFPCSKELHPKSTCGNWSAPESVQVEKEGQAKANGICTVQKLRRRFFRVPSDTLRNIAKANFTVFPTPCLRLAKAEFHGSVRRKLGFRSRVNIVSIRLCRNGQAARLIRFATLQGEK